MRLQFLARRFALGPDDFLVVGFLETQCVRIFRVHFQRARNLNIRFVELAPLGGGIRQLQPGIGQPGHGLLGLLIDADADFLRQRISFLVQLGSLGEFALFLSGFSLAECPAENDHPLLAPHRFILGCLSRVLLGAEHSRRGQQSQQAQQCRNFVHGFLLKCKTHKIWLRRGTILDGRSFGR